MKARRPLTITSRTSSIANAFVQAIIPNIEPLADELAEALSVLGMSPTSISCVYCGGGATDWDHLRPLVKDGRPTGFVTEVRNLVPACGPCNQSKSGAEWRKWMLGTARGSPKTRGVADLKQRVERLEAYEQWRGGLQPISLSELVPPGLWLTHWNNLEAIKTLMREAQRHADVLRDAIGKALLSKHSATQDVA